MRSSSTNWLVNAALLAGSLVVSIVVAEVILRVVGFSYPVLWTYDDITGSKHFAGAQGWQRQEGEAFITINPDGLRDREHSKTKPPNTVRIAVLGDSMAEALQVPLESTFWSFLGRELKNCTSFADRDVEVINFGVAGHGTAQELLTFRHRAAAYSPDISILAFYPGNDVRNNSKELEPQKMRPFFTIHNEQLVLDNNFLNEREYLSFKSTIDNRKILFNLRSFQLMRKLKSTFDQRNAGRAGAAGEANIERGLDNDVFLAPATQPWIDAWWVTERLIAATRDEVVATGGRFLLISIPIAIQVDPNPALRERFARKLQTDDLWYPETRIREFADRQNVDAITPGRTFGLQAEKTQTYLHGFKNTAMGSGHLNEHGHRLVGQALARHLCNAE